MGGPGGFAGWALHLRRRDASALAGLRLINGLLVLEAGDELWLRGVNEDDLTATDIRSVPALRRYHVLDDGQLLPLGRHVPEGSLPRGAWTALRKWIEIESPAAQYAGRLAAKVPLALERGGEAREANLLLISANDWRRFGETASALRLHPLAFAMDDTGRVLVRGMPLPPLPGRSFVLDDRVALPAGFRFSRGIEAKDVADLLQLASDSIAWFEAEGTWTLLNESNFVAAHRSAIRASTV